MLEFISKPVYQPIKKKGNSFLQTRNFKLPLYHRLSCTWIKPHVTSGHRSLYFINTQFCRCNDSPVRLSGWVKQGRIAAKLIDRRVFSQRCSGLQRDRSHWGRWRRLKPTGATTTCCRHQFWFLITIYRISGLIWNFNNILSVTLQFNLLSSIL